MTASAEQRNETEFPKGTPPDTARAFREIGLERKPGQPLNSYSITSEQVELLRHHLVHAAQYRRLTSNAAPFVLWAAETFRREYDGGQYAWEFLQKPLNLKTDYQSLHDLTRRGLHWFGRQLTVDDGVNYYLKTLAAEGGLPEALLADPSGLYRRSVRGLMADIEKVGIAAPRDLLVQLAAQRISFLPLGFRTSEFRDLFLEFCLTLLERRAEIPPSVPSEARQAWLDANSPGWKDELPLRLDSLAARSLLLDAVTSDAGANQQELATRLLVKVKDAWVPKLSISKTAEIPEWQMGDVESQINSMRLFPDAALSLAAPSLVLSADKETASKTWDVRRETAGRRSVFSMPLDRPISFRLLAEGRQIGTYTPPGGQAIDPNDIPTIWKLFEKGQDGAAPILKKVGASALRTREPELWVLAGKEAARFDGLDVEQEGDVQGATLWRVSGRGRVFGDGWSLSLTTDADQENTDRIIAHGITVPGMRDVRGMEVHQGLPNFYSQSEEGIGRHLPPKNLCWRPVGQRNWKVGLPDAKTSMGLFQFGWRDDQSATRAFTSLRLLPESARFTLREMGEGQLSFSAEGIPPGTSITLLGQTTGMVSTEGSLSLPLAHTAEHLGRISLHIRPHDGTGRPFDVSLPRPSTRGFFLDQDDRVLMEDLSLDLGMLAGWRVSVPPDRIAELRIRLLGDSHTNQPVTLKIQNETALSSFIPRFRRLMTIGGPDSELRLRVLVGANQSRRITLRRHLRDGNWHGSSLTVPGAEAEIDPDGMNLHCVNLLAPETSCDMDGIQPEDDIECRLPNHPGPWLVFARDSSGLIRPPRPIRRNVQEEPLHPPQFSESFVLAGKSSRRSERIRAFATVLQDLYNPLSIGDLSLFEQQIDDLGGSEALSSLDSVVALSNAPELAALLVLRGNAESLPGRMELENASPFSWTTLPISAWKTAIERQVALLVSRMISANIGADDARKFANDAVLSRLRGLRDRRPEIFGQIFLAASETGLLRTWKELGAVPTSFSDPKKALIEAARRAISKNEGARQAFDLRSPFAPVEFNQFYEPIRGLLDAPIVAAEFALSRRNHPVDPATAIALLHYRFHDPDYFETAMPAAIALIQQQN
ncbi:STY4851/ECs_5259 family protein [Aliiroseovarius sp. S253]|uniref:STY4851/ECs_5259 family protein n=1 Tax=Aliiroseovarius sp. S253 TaxID=3415133 RepID=UPI003C7A901B